MIVPGTQAATIVMPRLVQQLAALRKQRDEIAAEVERLVLAHPLWPVLTSMPGVGVRIAARLLTEAAHKAPPRIWRPTQASRWSPGAQARRSAASIHPDGATRCSSAPCSSLPSRPYETQSRGSITRARPGKASDTTRPSSHRRGDAATSCSPCCVMAPFTNPSRPLTLDERHRGIPAEAHSNAYNRATYCNRQPLPKIHAPFVGVRNRAGRSHPSHGKMRTLIDRAVYNPTPILERDLESARRTIAQVRPSLEPTAEWQTVIAPSPPPPPPTLSRPQCLTTHLSSRSSAIAR